MAGLTGAVHWWEESQMRVLVLSSLVLQFLLFIFTFLRRLAIPGWIRFIMWLAYLGSDAMAIYALATLFNRHKDQDRGGSSTLELEVLWAPILLLHLGGHDGITAYNIEDNELWSRHLLTAVSQVTVAIYVFWKSWPPGGDKRLLQASILLFVPGVLKCFTKPWALKRASITSLVSSPEANRTAKKGEADEILKKYVKQAKAFVQEQKNKDNEARAGVQNGDHPPPQQEKQNNNDEMDPFWFEDDRGERPPAEFTELGRIQREWILDRRECILRHEACKLFVDLSSPYAGRRLSIFKYFWVLSQDQQALGNQKKTKAETTYRNVRRGLASAFLLLYTRVKTAGLTTESDHILLDHSSATVSNLIWISRAVLPWAAIGLFHKSHREAYNDTDANITYALLCCTAVLEFYSIFSISYSVEKKNASTSYAPPWEGWPEMVAQYSLMRYYTRNKNHGKLMWIASMLGCKDLVDQRWSMKPCFSSRRITELVLKYLRAGWEEKIQDDVASYRSFMDNRGHCALEGNDNEHLRWSIKEPFDESVLLWHIATDLCFFSSPPLSEHRCAFAKTPSIWSDSETEEDTPPAEETKCGELTACRAVQCRQMSNYMVYLLFVNPEMLLPGTRRNLFTTAYNELEVILGDNNLNPQSCCYCCQQVVEKGLMDTLIKTMEGKPKIQDPEIGQPKGGCNGNFILDAWDLSQGLLKLKEDHGDEKMWEVIQGVWVEMLCFSASRCRGYLHAKALGSGGEFLSYVWLLLFYMGMETFTERLQREREELPSQEGNNSAAQAPQASDAYNGNATTSSTSGIRNRRT